MGNLPYNLTEKFEVFQGNWIGIGSPQFLENRRRGVSAFQNVMVVGWAALIYTPY